MVLAIDWHAGGGIYYKLVELSVDRDSIGITGSFVMPKDVEALAEVPPLRRDDAIFVRTALAFRSRSRSSIP